VSEHRVGPGDAGLPNERTALAWTRTSLSIVAVGALVAKQSGSTAAAIAVIAAVALATGWLMTHNDRRHRSRHHGAAGASVAPGHVAAIAAMVAALSVLSAVIVIS
jgi:putative membrane protein